MEVGSLNLSENHVDIAIFTFAPLLPFFGSWKAYKKKLYGPEKVELRLSACDFDRLTILEDYILDRWDDFNIYEITKSTGLCIDREDLDKANLKGEVGDRFAEYISVEFEYCWQKEQSDDVG